MASVAGMINLNNESTSEAASRGSARSRQEVWLLLTPEPPRPCLPFTPPPTARRSDVRATCMYNLSHVDYVCDCGHQCEGDCCKKKIPTGFLIQNKPKRWSVTLVSLGRCDLCRASPARFIKTIPIRRFTETHLHYTLWMNLMNHIFSPYEGKTLPLVFS